MPEQSKLFDDAVALDPRRPRPLTKRERIALMLKCDSEPGRKTASFSKDEKYRYMLTRFWGERGQGDPVVMFIGLNPSTADQHKNDPTITRCIGYAMDWGYSGLYMANLFSLRSTDPRAMDDHPSPAAPPDSGGLHGAIVASYAARASLVVAAWGSDRAIGERGELMCRLIGKRIECLGVNNDGNPKHPLYLRRDTRRLVYWES